MSLPDLLQSVNVISAIVNISVAAVIAHEARRMGVGYPRVVLLLVGFFLLRALNRAAAPDPLFGYGVVLDIATDVALIAATLALLVAARGITRSLLIAHGEAQLRAEEYDRALRDYTQLMRHRIANPLAVVMGAAQTLEREDLDVQTRQQLVAAIIDAGARIEQVSLHPSRQGPEEHELRPRPRLNGEE